MKNRILIRLVPILIAAVVVFFQRCSSEKFTNEAGRTVHLGMDRGQEATLGLQAYQQVLSTSRTITSGTAYDLVKKCAQRLAAATGESGREFSWQVSLVDSPEVNAFCLPGGKIVVYTGILPIAKTETGLAVVMGHEMAHATLRHGSERMLQQKTASTLMSGVNFSTGDMDPTQRRAIMGVIGAGAQYGFLLPFSRDHESEADAIGLRYMARAGYDPHEALSFWSRMGATGGKAPPEYASTHPAHETRIKRLTAELPKVLPLYEQATKQAASGSF